MHLDIDIRALSGLEGHATTLLLIIGEALSNVTRHSKATTCRMVIDNTLIRVGHNVHFSTRNHISFTRFCAPDSRT